MKRHKIMVKIRGGLGYVLILPLLGLFIFFCSKIKNSMELNMMYIYLFFYLLMVYLSYSLLLIENDYYYNLDAFLVILCLVFDFVEKNYF